MGMLEGSPGGFAVVFEDEDVAKALVVFQVEHAIAISPQNVFRSAGRESGERRHVVWRLDDNFVGADAVHFVKKAFAFAVEIALDAKRGEAIRDDANAPAWRVGAAAVASVNQNFGRRFALGARAERAVLLPGKEDAFAEKVGGALRTVSGNDDPAARDGIFTQLRQSEPPRRESVGSVF